METDVTKNPGYKLRDILEKIFPLQNTKDNFINKIDEALYADERFVEMSYYSSLNYLLRRLIVTSDFIKRKYNTNNYPPHKFLHEIRNFLRYGFNFPNSKIDDIYTLILDCLRERGRKLSSGKKNEIIKHAQSRNYGCYICGKSLIYNRSNYSDEHPDLVEVEHIWPHSLGGSNELFNLEVVCAKCNRNKESYIDEYDFHFENICILHDKQSEEFKNEFKNVYRIAAYLKDNPECYKCGKKAVHQNPLDFSRQDKADSWHYLNIFTYCNEHIKE